MTITRWDNVEIVRQIDRMQRERGGGPLQGISGLDLMDRIGGRNIRDHQLTRGFVQELSIARHAGLLSFRIQSDARPGLIDSQPHLYLQTLWDFALTVAGQDRARGQTVVQPLPDPAEDDGRPISDLILRQVAGSITEQYAPDEVIEFLRGEGIPPEPLSIPEGSDAGDAHKVLAVVWRWGSEGRRIVRRFVGRWLDNQLLTGPNAELRANLIDQLARQGWRVRNSDGSLVIAEPVRGIPIGAPFLRVSRLHPWIEAEARPQFLIEKPEQGVFASMRAVEVRVRQLAGAGNDVIGVDLMNRAFGPTGPLSDPQAPRGEQEGTRALFAGAYGLLRNPAGHRPVDYGDLSEAGEAVQIASLLMRILDRVADRLVAAGRDVTDLSGN